MPPPRMAPDSPQAKERRIAEAMSSGMSREEAEAYVDTLAQHTAPVDPLRGFVRALPGGGFVDSLINPGARAQEQANRQRAAAAAKVDASGLAVPGALDVPAPAGLYPGTGTPDTMPFAADPYLGLGYQHDASSIGAGIADDRAAVPVGGQQPLYGDVMDELVGERARLAERTRDVVAPGRPDMLTALEEAQADPMAVAAQRRALQGLTDVVDQGGLTAIDRARLADTRAQADQWLRGQREATMADMEARGMAGSGTDLMSQLAAQQGAAARMSTENLQTNALAQQRALDALSRLGQQGGDLRGTSYGEALNLASAKDRMAKWNQQMLRDWQATQRKDEWDRYYAQRDAEAAKYNRAIGAADRVERQGQQQQQARSAQIGAIAKAAMGSGDAGASDTPYRPGRRRDDDPYGRG